MNIANALRDMIAAVESTQYASVYADEIKTASAALAAHDAAVSATSAHGIHGFHCLQRDDAANVYASDEDARARVIACVNACQGIADPSRLVAAARAMANAHGPGEVDDAAQELTDSLS